MTIDEILIILQATLANPLTELQELVLRSSWDGLTYTRMAREAHYGEERVRRVAAELWHQLGQVWQIEIHKSTFRHLLEPRKLTRKERLLVDGFRALPATVSFCDFPNGPVPLGSPFYIPRTPWEETINLAIATPGGAVCLKSPKKMGKSSLLLRVLAHAQTLGYHTVSLDLQQADSDLFTNLDRFLRWFVANLCRELGIDRSTAGEWNGELGSKVSCSIFVEKHILSSLDAPFLLVLHQLDWILNYPAIAADFILLLQSWYKRSKQSELWQKLRLIVVHTSEILVPLHLLPSPLDIGLSVTLPGFDRLQVELLAKTYKLDWIRNEHLDLLMEMLGGHPYLLRLTMYELAKKVERETDLYELFTQATTDTSIYNEYLNQYLVLLREQPELAAALEIVLASHEPVYLESLVTTKLQNLGLIRIVSDRCCISCELYRRYFHQYLQNNQRDRHRVETLERENQQLRVQAKLDEVTQIPNRRYFQAHLQAQWKHYSQKLNSPTNLALILCDIDYFNLYNRIYGTGAADNCLRLIANTIEDSIQELLHYKTPNLLGRYREEQFAILLLAETVLATTLAETIRERIKQLGIPCEYPGIGGLPANVLTISIGVASLTPTPTEDAISLIQTAENALQQAKRRGRDRVAIG